MIILITGECTRGRAEAWVCGCLAQSHICDFVGARTHLPASVRVLLSPSRRHLVRSGEAKVKAPRPAHHSRQVHAHDRGNLRRSAPLMSQPLRLTGQQLSRLFRQPATIGPVRDDTLTYSVSNCRMNRTGSETPRIILTSDATPPMTSPSGCLGTVKLNCNSRFRV